MPQQAVISDINANESNFYIYTATGQKLKTVYGWVAENISSLEYDPCDYQIQYLRSIDIDGEKTWLTPYHYCSNNPMNRIDPDGLDDYFDNQRFYLNITISKRWFSRRHL
ncbi:MAG: hypothetical protein ACK5MK_14560 [Dysgonomonas sp.]